MKPCLLLPFLITAFLLLPMVDKNLELAVDMSQEPFTVGVHRSFYRGAHQARKQQQGTVITLWTSHDHKLLIWMAWSGLHILTPLAVGPQLQISKTILLWRRVCQTCLGKVGVFSNCRKVILFWVVQGVFLLLHQRFNIGISVANCVV